MTPQLEDYQHQFERIKQDAEELIAGLNPYGFNWHPAPGSWSIAECLDHLIVAGNLLLPGIDEAIRNAQAKNLRDEGPFRYGVRGTLFIRAQEPPVKRRIRTSPQYVPSTARLTEDVQREFRELQDRLIERVKAADGLNLSKMLIPSPAISWLRFNAAVWFAATAAHERRHLWQARRTKESSWFPSSES
ncbi:DinB family protein [bacterium]|nr:MAG: DinB family protein [bacterium]